MIDSTAPTGSSEACDGSLDLGIITAPKPRASRMNGTFTRKIEPTQKWLSSQPLITGPSAPAPPVTAAQIEMALARSAGGNTLTRIDRVDGMMNAAEAPMSARHAMNCHIDVDQVARSAATRNPTRPICSTPLRPNRSPMEPEVKSRPANTSEYAAMTHCSDEVVAL